MQTVLLLTISSIFMTMAWYGHLKYQDSPLWIAILVSWLIASVEYCFQVRVGSVKTSGDSWRFITKSRRHVSMQGTQVVREGGLLYWSMSTN